MFSIFALVIVELAKVPSGKTINEHYRKKTISIFMVGDRFGQLEIIDYLIIFSIMFVSIVIGTRISSPRFRLMLAFIFIILGIAAPIIEMQDYQEFMTNGEFPYSIHIHAVTIVVMVVVIAYASQLEVLMPVLSDSRIVGLTTGLTFWSRSVFFSRLMSEVR